MKRVFTFLIAIITVLGFIPTSVSAQTYCASNATSTADSECDYVGLIGNTTSIDNNTAGICANYSDFTALTPADISPGSAYQINVTYGTCGGSYTKTCKVFIDWNQDFDFDDVDEYIGVTPSSSATSSYVIPLTVPFTASIGTTRMRVVVEEVSGAANVFACGTYTWGETEDYTVSVMPMSDVDAGVTAILAPTPNENEAAVVPVEVILTNFGTLPLVAADVVYALDGGAAVTTTWLGLLSTGETDTVTLPNLTIPPGSHDFCSWSVVTGDTIPQDDTTCMSFYGLPLWDAGVIAILSPGALELENTSVAPEVTIENFGVNTLTTMDIVYTINSGAPTTFAWTGSLAPGSTTSAILPAFIVPGGNDTICAYTVLALDGDATNDETCFEFYADPQFDFAAVDFLSPEAYCGMGLEDIIVTYVNQGDTVTSFDMGYSYNGGAAIIEPVTQTVNPGDTLTYTFTTQVDMTAPVVDITFAFSIWCDVTGDPLFNNDTIYVEVISPHIPMSPIAQNDTVVYGNFAELIAFSNDTILWFESDTAGAPNIAVGNYFTTPVLLDTTNYWIQATGGAGDQSWTFDNDLEGWSATAGCSFPDIFDWYDDAGQGVAYAFSPYGNSNQLLTSPVVMLGGATEITLSFNHRFVTEACCDHGLTAYRLDGGPWIHFIPTIGTYSGNDGLYNEALWNNCSSSASIPLFYGNSGGYIYSEGIIDVTGAATVEIIFEYTSDASVQNLGWFINDVTIEGIGGCSSNLVPISAIVTDIPTQDVGVVGITAPVTGIELTATETVTVEVLNYGLAEISNFDVSFFVDNGTAVTETVTDTVQPGDIYTYTFVGTGDLSMIGWHDVTAYTDHVDDIYAFNDTMMIQVESLPLTYCTSNALYAGYEDIVNVEIGLWSHSDIADGTNYQDYTGFQGPFLGAGVTYDISIESDFPPGYTYSYNCWFEAYIDFNHDGIYDETTDELVFSMQTTSSNTVTGTFTVPINAVSAVSGLRVVLVESGNATGTVPCGTYGYGQTEDYLIMVAPVIANDGGVIEFITPGSFAVENFPEPVEVIVRNFGSDTLTAFNVAYVFNGGAPVITPWTGVLAPTMTTNIILPDVLPISLTNDICAYTIVPGDSNTFNDETCHSFYATPQYEAGVSSIYPQSGCGLGVEDIVLTIQNYGDTITGNLLATYIINGGPPEVAVVITQILPNDSLSFAFPVPYDFSVTTANDTFYIEAYINLLGDPIQLNDSIAIEVISMYTPDPPIGYNDTIPYGTTAEVSAEASADVEWFEDLSGLLPPISTDTFYVTPVLYDTTTYFVQSLSGAQSTGDITTTFAAGNGQTGNMFDITAYNTITIDSFDINPTGNGIYEVWYRPGTYVGFNTSQAGWTLLGSDNITNPGTNVPAPLPVGGLTIPAGETYGIYVTGVTAGVSYTNGNGANQLVEDLNIRLDLGLGGSYWNVTFNPRVWNGTVYYTAGVAGCASNLIPVSAIVEGIPDWDGGITEIYTPVSGIELSNAEPVTVEIYNWGVNSIANFPVYYSINGGTPYMDIVQVMLGSGDHMTYTFNDPAPIGAFATYNICAWTAIIGDTWTVNDSTCVSVTNDPLIYCPSNATANTYEEIIDVTIGTWSNFSGPASGAMYSDFTGIPGPFLAVGNTFDISITSDFFTYTTQYTTFIEVYIDYNHDGVYTEPDEIAFASVSTSSNTVTGSFMVPYGAVSATTGMRVVMEETNSGANVLPCGTYTWGETEDYLVMIAPQIPNDAGVTEILQPLNNLIENFVSPVEVTVQNFGTDTIWNMNVNYEIDGGAPITTAFVGPLAPASNAIVFLPDLTIPGGYYDICAYTVLAGDSNTFNDMTCMNLFATPQFEAGMLSFDAPEAGCDLGLEDVTVTFENLGDTIAIGNLDLSYAHSGITAVTEPYPNIVYPFDTVTYTFTTQVNLAITASTSFEFLAWLDLVGDPIQTNDTIGASVWSGLTPPAPTANDITIWSGEFGVLDVTNLDTTLVYTWYDSDTISVGNEYTYTTPTLFDTTTYFVETTSGGAGAIAITEIDLGSNDYIEISNLSSSDFDATGYIVAVSNAYNIINSINTIFWNLGNFTGEEVQFRTDLAGANYWGNNLFWNPGAPPSFTGWAIILDPAGEIVDMVIWGWTAAQIAAASPLTINGFVVDLTTGWVGDGIMNYPSENITRIFFDTDEAGDWINTTVDNIGFFNSALIGTQAGGACGSPLVPVTVFVQYADYDAAVWNVTAPVSGSYLGIEDVTAEVYNNGLNPISNFPISYTLDGGTAVLDTFTSTLQPGDMLPFTFGTPVDLTVFTDPAVDPPYIVCVFTALLNDGLTNNDTSCTGDIWNLEGDGETCATAFPYVFINDPAIFSATTSLQPAEWWSFVLPGDYSNVVVSMCGSSYDTYLQVYDDCNSSAIGTNDDACGLQSQLTFSSLSAGTYYAKCYGFGSSYGAFTLNITGTAISYVDLIPTHISCNGLCDGEIEVDLSNFAGTSPFTYVWSNGETTANLTGLCAGYYEVTVTGFLGQTGTANETLTEPPTLLVSLFGTDVTTIGGNDGAIDMWVTGGTTPYTFLWSSGATTEDLNNIFGGVYSVTVADANGCVVVETLPILAPIPPPWMPLVMTPEYHVIDIPMNAVVDLDAVALPYGSYIGVFYDQGGSTALGGVAVWAGINTQLIAFGEQFSMNNGFAPGEYFTWRVWDVTPATAGEYDATVVYNTIYPDLDQFVIGGFSGVFEIHALSIQTQTIELPNGWSLMSTYIIPDFPDIEDVFYELVGPPAFPYTGNLIIAKNSYGMVYWPQYMLDNINDLVIGEGYQVKLTDPDTIDVSGMAAVPELTPLSLPQGWSILGYIRQAPADISIMLSPMVAPMFTPGTLEIAKDYLGNIYWPFYDLNNIGNMLPGDGYQIKLNYSFLFTYVANSAPISSGAKAQFINDPVYYEDANNTGNNMSLGIPMDAWSEAPMIGDEIGVFSPNGELIGSAVYSYDFTGVTIWGNEIINEEDITKGQEFSLKLWRNTTGIEEEIVVESWSQGNGLYEQNAISIISKLSIASSIDTYALYQNMPNPFKESTDIKFYIPVSGEVTISVYNTLGEKLVEVVSQKFDAGEHTVSFDANHLPSGNYFYKMVTDEFVSTKPMNINR